MRIIYILIIAIVIVFTIVGAGLFLIRNQGEIVCTEEAKGCIDGSTVGRNPDLDCEFDACPEQTEEICIEIGCPEGSIYAGSINSDKYYLCSCGWARIIKPKNLVCFPSDAKPIMDGRTRSKC